MPTSPRSASSRAAAAAPVTYTVTLDRARHRFAVQLRIAQPAAVQRVSLPVWIPGSYLVREFARHLSGLQARQGSHSLQDPAWLLPQWLRHATAHFGVLRAGSVVTTGSWCGLLMAQAGERVQVAFDGLGVLDVML